MGTRVAVVIGGILASAAFAAPAPAAVTIGADVAQTPMTWGTCAFAQPARRPCMIVSTFAGGRQLTSTCDGTVTRFRLNGFPRPNNRYRLRVVRQNADGSYTGTATSAQVAIEVDGVNEYATSLQIATGETIGIDFQESTENFGLRWIGTFPSNSELYFDAFPADGVSAKPTGPDPSYYLFNADVECGGKPAGPAPIVPPSNAFTIVGVKGTTLSVDVASAGTVSVVDGSVKLATASKKAKAKPKMLKPSSASGGPGTVQVALKLTGAAKKKLKEKGKVNLKAHVSFAPTGGTAATQTTTFKIKKPKKANSGG